MVTSAFKMKLKPGFKGEYKRRHQTVWPEILAILQKDGIHDYYIFFDEETDILFAVHNSPGHDASKPEVTHPRNEAVQKWWNYMADIMEVNPDNSPVMKPLEEVFYMK